jgi:hypothetical protein
MAFGDAANGGVARHLRDEVKIESDDGSVRAHLGCRMCSFAARVTCANHDYVEFFIKLIHKTDPGFSLADAEC